MNIHIVYFCCFIHLFFNFTETDKHKIIKTRYYFNHHILFQLS